MSNGSFVTFDDGSNINVRFCGTDSEPSTQSILFFSICNLQGGHDKGGKVRCGKKKRICETQDFLFETTTRTLLKARESKRDSYLDNEHDVCL